MMTTTQRPLAKQRWTWLLVGVLLGALPGVLLVAVAQFLVDGEPQLTAGVAGMWLTAVGALAGLIVMLRRTRARRDEP